MKYLAIIFLAYLVVANLGDNEQGKIVGYLKECEKTTGVTSDWNDANFTHERKCFIKCIFDKYEVIKPDGTFDRVKTLEMTDRVNTDGEEKASSRAVVEKCLDEAKPGSDPCETSFLLFNCVKKFEEQNKK